jgi:hypothetical protein
MSTPYLKDAICKLKNTKNVDDKIYYDFTKLETEIIVAVPQVPNAKKWKFTT